MNALDYGRDNRLRLWFIDPNFADSADNDSTKRQQAFLDAITSLAVNAEKRLRQRGYCVIIVGEKFKRTYKAHPSEIVLNIITSEAPSLQLRTIFEDEIPNVRRTRQECNGVKREHFLVFQRNR